MASPSHSAPRRHTLNIRIPVKERNLIDRAAQSSGKTCGLRQSDAQRGAARARAQDQRPAARSSAEPGRVRLDRSVQVRSSPVFDGLDLRTPALAVRRMNLVRASARGGGSRETLDGRWWSLCFIAGSFVPLQVRLRVRHRIADLLLPHASIAAARTTIAFAQWAWPMIHLVHLGAFLASFGGRRFTWAGINYRPRGRTVSVERPPVGPCVRVVPLACVDLVFRTLTACQPASLANITKMIKHAALKIGRGGLY
jgi:hypothetical protein